MTIIWRSKRADFSKITAPAFVVASWTDQGLHTRGTFEGFKHIASKQKYLLAHGQKKWAHYYVPENMRQACTPSSIISSKAPTTR